MADVFKISLEGDELHDKLGGGIPKNAFVLIEAPNGIGKSILAQRITYGAIKNNQTVSYISTELPLMGFLSQMNSLRYDIKSKLISKEIKFISLFPSLGSINFEPNLIEKMLNAETLFDSDIIIFDSLNELLVKDDINLKESFELISNLKRIASRDKAIVFCVEPDSLSQKLYSLLKPVCDVYVRMEEREQYGNKIKIMKVERFNSAASTVEEEIPFKVRAGIGIVVELAS